MNVEEFLNQYPIEPCPTCGEDTLRAKDEDGKILSCMLCIMERMLEFRFTREEIRQYADRQQEEELRTL